MKREIIFDRFRGISLMLLASLFLFGGSPSTYAKEGVSYYSDDMYGVHSQERITQQKVAEEYAEQAMEEIRMRQWADLLDIDVDQLARQGEEYNTAFGEKLRALASEEYQLPDSYYEYSYQGVLEELAQYDPALYDASINSNGELSIEPKYMSSIYGVWGDPYYDYTWVYGYPAYGYAPYAYYSMWGYPYSNWWFGARFGGGFGYNPWWGGYYGWGWGPSWGFGWGVGYLGYRGWYAPHNHHRPNQHYSGRGGSRTIVRRASSTQSPSSSSRSSGSRNSDGSTVGRSSSNSKGGTSYNRSASSSSSRSSSSNNSSRTRSTSTPSRGTSTPSRGTSTPSSSTPVRTNSIGR